MEFGVCSQGCENTIGSYKCACAPGFKLLEDKRECKTIGRTDALLLYAGDKSVNWLKLKTKHLNRIANDSRQVVGITYDGSHIYWTDISIEAEAIKRARTDGSELEVNPISVAMTYISNERILQ